MLTGLSFQAASCICSFNALLSSHIGVFLRLCDTQRYLRFVQIEMQPKFVHQQCDQVWSQRHSSMCQHHPTCAENRHPSDDHILSLSWTCNGGNKHMSNYWFNTYITSKLVNDPALVDPMVLTSPSLYRRRKVPTMLGRFCAKISSFWPREPLHPAHRVL